MEMKMHHIVSLSGGSASAVAADRVLNRYDFNDVTLWFADTKWEDEDLYRFLDDLESRWEKKIVRFTDGRNPLEVHDKQDFIPNHRFAQCSAELKQKPFKKFIMNHPKPLTVHLGMDWSEEHRHAKPKEVYESIDGVSVDFPLMWEPLAYLGYQKVVSDWGIKPPRLYSYGFPHNNCGGRCVRQGNSEWIRLLKHFPDRFKEVSDWEQEKQKGEKAATHAITEIRINGVRTPLSLQDLAQQNETTQMDMFTYEGDEYGCFCEY